MKKSMVVMLALLLASGNAFALLDDNSTNTSSSAQAGAIAGAAAGATAINGPNVNTNVAGGGFANAAGGSVNFNPDIDSRSSAYQNQHQKQNQTQNQASISGAKSNQNQTNEGNELSVNLDASDRTKIQNVNLATTAAPEGTSSGTVGSILGAISISGTEDYKKVKDRMLAATDMYNAGVMDRGTYCYEMTEAYFQLRDASQPNLHYLTKKPSRGQHLLNGLGLFSANHAWTDPSKQKIGCLEGLAQMDAAAIKAKQTK